MLYPILFNNESIIKENHVYGILKHGYPYNSDSMGCYG